MSNSSPAVAAPGTSTAWQPIESAPKDGHFQIWIPALHEQGFVAVHVGWWNQELGRVDACYHDSLDDYEITHWQPLPAPPAVAADSAAESKLASTERHEVTSNLPNPHAEGAI